MRGGRSGRFRPWRLIGLLIAAGLAFFPVVYPGVPSPAGVEYSTITDYRADFTVDRAGVLHAHEHLSVDFPIRRHGIYRFFDVVDPRDPHVRYPARDFVVRLDGRPVQVRRELYDGSRILVLRIGDPDHEIAGPHDFDISYAVPGVLAPAGSGSQFYWNLIPQGWRLPIRRSTLHVTLPADHGPVRCAVGVGSTTGCTVTGGGRDFQVTTADLAPGTPVTVQTDVRLASPGQVRTPWTWRWDAMLGRSVGTAVLLGLLALLGAVLGWRWARRSREAHPPYPLCYTPPDGIGPAQAAYLIDEVTHDRLFTATLLQQGSLGLTRIEHQSAGTWRITALDGDWAQADPVTARVGALLKVWGSGELILGTTDVETGRRVITARAALRNRLADWGRRERLMVPDPRYRVTSVLVPVAWVAALLCALPNHWPPSAAGLGFSLFAVLASTALRQEAHTRRTAKARDLWMQIGGFRRVLSTSSSEARFDFAAHRGLYQQYVPWAVALGCAEAFERKYRVETGEDPPTLSYVVGFVGGYYGGSGFSTAISQSLNGAVAGDVGAYLATQAGSASSSGDGFGGGGGFAGGGGGGGGGGGSW